MKAKKKITKKVVEKKTGEKYTSKTAMKKHEKSETPRMKMKEGAVSTYRKGGKKC